MSSVTQRLAKMGLITPPDYLPTNVHYETKMGSIAYGVATDESDVDVYGFGIPPKTIIFPHLAGEIHGFGRQIQRFEQYQKHHVKDESTGKEWDLAIYNIVKYFALCMDNNPNMIDSLFTPQHCVLHATAVGQHVRENRRLFLHKGAWHKFKGYAYSQLHKMATKNPTGKRKEMHERYGYDVKFAYHVVRLLDEAEQILTAGDIDLSRNAEHLKAIRRGEVPEADIRAWATEKERSLESLYEASTLPYGPDEGRIRTLLLECLEMHYGRLGPECVVTDAAARCISEIQVAIDRYHSRG